MLNGLKEKLAIRPKMRSFLTSFFRHNLSNDIDAALKLRALNSTCAYIEEKMYDVPAFSQDRFQVIKHAVGHVGIEGVFCEFGVYQGETLKYTKTLTDRPMHAFDSFQGLPEFWIEGYDKGHFALPAVPDFGPQVSVHPGWFQDTVPVFAEKFEGKIAFLHIDCDLYSSTKTIFDHLGKFITKGTVIVFDEYFNYPFWEKHEYLAFQEFIEKSGFKYRYLSYSTNVKLGSQVAAIIL